MSKKTFFIITITLIGAFLRFYNLQWGQPYPFHPDEHNLAAAVERLNYNLSCLKQDLSNFQITNITNIQYLISNILSLNSQYRQVNSQYRQVSNLSLQNLPSNCNLNPHFFAYGSFPIYLTYFSSQILNFFFQISNIKYLISNTLILRFYSALASTLTIPLVFLITQIIVQTGFKPVSTKFTNSPNIKYLISLFAALLAAFTPGLIQAAHFGTTESLLTFFFLIILYLSLKILTCKFQAPSAKRQINSKHQAPNSKQSLNSNIQIRNKRFEILNLENWKLFGIWDLGFGIYTIALAIVVGLALSTKLTALLFLPIPLLAISLSLYRRLYRRPILYRRFMKRLYLISQYLNIFFIFSRLFVLLVLFVILVLLVIFLTSPFYFLDYPSLKSSMDYETGVALGTIDVFYTRQFIETKPFLFQAQKIFPFALSWPLFIFGALGFVLLLLNTVFRVFSRKISRRFAILLTAFLIYLIPNAIVYAKWTRFLTPIFPFFPIFAACLLYKFQAPGAKLQLNSRRQAPNYQHKVLNLKFKICDLFGICKLGFGIYTIVSTIVSGLSFFSIYLRPDVRFTASDWIYQNIPENSHLLFETANVIDIPIPTSTSYKLRFDRPELTVEGQATSYSRTSFNFYDLDINPQLRQDLLDELTKADYLIIPSRRIFANYTRFPNRWPILNRYYDLLFSGQLGFEPAAFFTSYPSFPLITQLLNYSITFPDESAEESLTVFDHPVIRIYRKTNQLSKQAYQKLLEL